MVGGGRSAHAESALPWRWLVRHPRPEVAQGLCYGRLDVPAQPDDTERAAQTLARRLPEGLVLRSSPRRRCLVLAERLHVLRPDLVLQPPEPWLAEMDLGDWEGRPWAALPEAELTAWTDDFGHYRAGGTGESVAAFLARIEAGLRAERMLEEPQVWIVHAGVIRAIHWLLEVRLASPRMAGASATERGPGRETGPADGGDVREGFAAAQAKSSDSEPGRAGQQVEAHAGIRRLPTAQEWPHIEIGFGEPWPLMERHRLRI